MAKYFVFMIAYGTEDIHAAMGDVCAHYEKQVERKNPEFWNEEMSRLIINLGELSDSFDFHR